jgi:hypothetical protein
VGTGERLGPPDTKVQHQANAAKERILLFSQGSGVVVTTVWTGNLAANMLLRPEAVARDASVDFRSGPGRLCLESAFVERGLDQQIQKLTRRYSLNSLSECLKIVDTCRQEAIAHFYPNSPYAVRLDEEGSRETGLFSLSLTSSTSSIALPAGPYAKLRARSATSTSNRSRTFPETSGGIPAPSSGR